MAKGLCEPLQQQQCAHAILFTTKYLYFARPGSVKTGLHCIDALSAAAGTGHSGNAHQMSPPRVPGTDVDSNPWAPRDLTRFHVAVLDEQPITGEVLSIFGQGYPHCDCQITRAATKLVCLETSGTFCESTVQG